MYASSSFKWKKLFIINVNHQFYLHLMSRMMRNASHFLCLWLELGFAVEKENSYSIYQIQNTIIKCLFAMQCLCLWILVFSTCVYVQFRLFLWCLCHKTYSYQNVYSSGLHVLIVLLCYSSVTVTFRLQTT